MGYSLLGSSLGPGQRDVRLYNNLTDSTANNNNTPHPMFPGWLRAELAMWKGVVEWGSLPHGDGSGDTTQAILGSGGANFDGAWMGNAAAIGDTNDNVVSGISSCGGGTLAFAEGGSGGWRIRFCENITWDDGPGNVQSGRFDIQSVMVHEYGHALGLGHSGVGGATMWPSIGSGAESGRSINSDDSAGVQAIYGASSGTKPMVCETSVSGNTLTIRGTRFDPVDNGVWFCPSAVTPAGTPDARIIIPDVPSTKNGTEITVTIPQGVSAGDIFTKTSASSHASLSNAFPMNMTGTISVPCPLAATSITPSTIEALDPGTAKSVQLKGRLMDTITAIDVNGTPVPSSRWSIIDNETIDIDMPQALLGQNTLNLTDGTDTHSIDFTVVEPASPKLELGTGDPLNATANGQQMNVILAGKVGTVHQVWFSKSNLPSNHALASWEIGNNFEMGNFRFALARTIGPDGYHQSSPTVVFGGMSSTVFYCQSIDLTTPPSPQYGLSNVQSITLTP